jgi:Hsp70 protein
MLCRSGCFSILSLRCESEPEGGRASRLTEQRPTEVLRKTNHICLQDDYRNHGPQPRGAPPPPPPMRPHVPFNGTTTSRDAFKGWQLPPAFPGIGLEILGDRMHVLVPANAKLPFAGKHVFSTVHDDQREICILIYAGHSPMASKNELLGQFDMVGLPRSKARTLQLEVSFSVDANRMLSVVARDLDSQRQYQWLQNGRMMVKTLSGMIGEVRESAEHGEYTMYPNACAGIA